MNPPVRLITLLVVALVLVPPVVIGQTSATQPRSRATWTMPDTAEQVRRDKALASKHKTFDPKENMVWAEVHNPGYAINLKSGSLGHPTMGSLSYALDLLDTGKPENLTRAVAILRKVLSLQDANPASKTYGLWSWYLEEPLEKMKTPDFNWADFGGTTLLQVTRDHRARLPADLARTVDASIVHCMRCIKKRNSPPSYTNIAVVGSYVTLIGGETLHLAEFLNYGRERLKRFYEYTLENGTFEEYNSPGYTMLALRELTRIKADTTDPEAQKIIDALVRTAWTEVARHFHAPTRLWAGPHSRSYHSIPTGPSIQDIQRATGGRVDFGVDPKSQGDPRIPIACPADLAPLFQPLKEPRTVVETFVKRFNRVGTTYLHPRFALGSINNEDLWNQRRALLLYFGNYQKPGYMHLRFLKNDYDFSSAWITTAQKEGVVVGAVNFVTNGGDTHISLDLVKHAKIKARDLRLRLEFGGPAVDLVKISGQKNSSSTEIKAGDLSLSFGLTCARFGDFEGKLIAGGDDKLRWLDVVLYSGAEREFDLAALQQAIIGFVFSVGPHGAVTSRLEAGKLFLGCDGLSVTVPVKPGSKPVGAAFAPN